MVKDSFWLLPTCNRLTPLVSGMRYGVCNVYYLYIVNVKLWSNDFVFVCYSFHGAQTARERESKPWSISRDSLCLINSKGSYKDHPGKTRPIISDGNIAGNDNVGTNL